jgi:hypothetical protein
VNATGWKLIAALALAAGICAWLVLACNVRTEPARAPSYSSYLEDVKVYNIDKDKVSWTAVSKRAMLSENGSNARLENVALEMPGEKVTLKAPVGVFDMDNNSLVLNGGITTFVRDMRMQTDSMRIIPGGKIDVANSVTLTGKGIKIEGGSLESGEDQKLKVKDNVKAVFY